MHIKQLALSIGAILGSLALPGCNLDIPDLNNPGLEQLQNNPTAASINTAATGLLVGNRGGKAAVVGYVNLMGILGRESYDFDSADTRFVSEMIQGNLSKSSPYGGALWAGAYANIRLGNIILHGVDKVAEFSDADRKGIRGFTHTINALDLFTVIITRDEIGAVIDTDHPLGEPLGGFVGKDAVYKEINRLLDLAATELAGAGTAFTFLTSPGFKGFDTPATFLKFNRARRARMAVYTTDYATALTALAGSFISDTGTPDFKAGVNYVYSLTSGDATNGLINPAIYAHPSLLTDVQMNGTTADLRYSSKVGPAKMDGSTVTAGSDPSLRTTIKFKIYTNVAPIAVIRNEELILLKAEALYYTGDKPGALAELNIVRTKSGGLLPLPPETIVDDATFLKALLYERRYSLMFEGGYRWIDLRRFNILLPLDSPAHIRNLRFPIPQAECDARPTEKACTYNSSDPIH